MVREKGIYCNSDGYVIYYGYSQGEPTEGNTWHVAPPPPVESLRKESGGYSLKWVDGGYVEQ